MAGIWRVLVVVACGCLMALAALAGQVGYDDDFGRDRPPERTTVSAAGRMQADDAGVHLNRYETETL